MICIAAILMLQFVVLIWFMMQFRQCVRFAWLRQVKIACLLSISSVGLADEIVSLKDGREVRIRDNYTWEYLNKGASTRNAFEDVETREIVQKAVDHMQKSLANAKGRVELAILQYQTGQDRTLNGVGAATSKPTWMWTPASHYLNKPRRGWHPTLKPRKL